MTQARRVVITGVGPVTPIGIGAEALWAGILARRTNVVKRQFQEDGETLGEFYVHQAEPLTLDSIRLDDEAVQAIRSWKNDDEEDPDLLYFLVTVGLALRDSGLAVDRESNSIGLFLTHENAGLEAFFEQTISSTARAIQRNPQLSRSELTRSVYRDCIKRGYDVQTFMYLYLVAKAFGFHGYSLYTNNACASGLYALETASRQIRYGDSEVAVVAAADYPNFAYKFLWFKDQGLYADDGVIRPFDVGAKGFVLGDGGAALVLEEIEHAHRRNARIYAEYLGGGFALEGWKVTVPAPDPKWYRVALQQALRAAELAPDAIDLINPHGIGSVATDTYEAQGIGLVFGRNGHRPRVTALKPYIGHNLGGSGLVETAILLLALHHQTIPPTLHCERLGPTYHLNVIRTLEPCRLQRVMKVSCGFAGYNAAAIFARI